MQIYYIIICKLYKRAKHIRIKYILAFFNTSKTNLEHKLQFFNAQLYIYTHNLVSLTKKMMKKYLPLLLFVFLLAQSCTKDYSHKTVEGYRPIYMNYSEIKSIKNLNNIPIVNTGKIYLYNNFVFINEKGYGVHVIDNSNPLHPQKRAFIMIPGNNDIAIKDDILYADNTSDLVSIDISNIDSVFVTKRIPNIYPLESQRYPNFVRGYFECVDTTLGYVISWEKGMLQDPKCYR